MKYLFLDEVENKSVAGPVKLYRIVVGDGTATAVINVYDGDAATDPQVASIDAATVVSLDYGGVMLSNGLFVDQITAASKATVAYE